MAVMATMSPMECMMKDAKIIAKIIKDVDAKDLKVFGCLAVHMDMLSERIRNASSGDNRRKAIDMALGILAELEPGLLSFEAPPAMNADLFKLITELKAPVAELRALV